jgi:hypothetical protein
MADIEGIDQIEYCPSCGAKRKGNYCRKCGEKKIIPERDFGIRKFMSQILWHFTHMDSKLLKTVRLLFFKPGFLTNEWIAGRRVGYMKPLQLFVMASVLFYFFLPSTNAHFTAPQDLMRGFEEHDRLANLFQYDFGKAFAEKQTALQVSDQVLSAEVQEAAAQRSKTWLFLLIPLWGSILFLFFKRQMPWLAPHLIFAMHALTFYILLDLCIHPFFYFSNTDHYGRFIFLLLTATFPVYQVLAAKRVFGNSWLITIAKVMGTAAGFVLLILAYRQLVTISTLLTL